MNQLRNLKIDFSRFVCKLASAARRGQQKLKLARGNGSKAARQLYDEYGISSVVLSENELLVVRVECSDCNEGLIFHPDKSFTFCKCGLKPIR